MAAMIAVFTVGRWTASPNKPLVKEAGVQKEEQLVPQRLRELNKSLKDDLEQANRHAQQSLAAAREARAALALQEPELNELRRIVQEGYSLVQALEKEMEHHSEMCPFRHEIYVSKKGDCWHVAGCHITPQIAEHNLVVVRGCAYCAGCNPPPFRHFYPGGWCIHDDMHQWLDDASNHLASMTFPSV